MNREETLAKTHAIEDYYIRLAADIEKHPSEPVTIETLFHPDFSVFYQETLVFKGRDTLEPHHEYLWRQTGKTIFEVLDVMCEPDRSAAFLKLQTEHLGTLYASHFFDFKDGLCIKQIDVLNYGTEALSFFQDMEAGDKGY